MKNQWRVIVGFILVIVVVLFAIFNNQQVPVSFGFTEIQGPLILIIIGSALIGALIAILTASTSLFRQKKTIKEQEKEIASFKTANEAKIHEEVQKVQREYENRIAEIRATYEAQLADKENALNQLTMRKRNNEQLGDTQPLDYYD
ncbi:hypothetical protein RU97_GL000917 [Enterococcus canis]|uniref:Lipopolysaccharide assembly protein A domain-containing protein n=1 Tax=Enterococcus canis TaxID=214095 RepID=A0A1L8RHV8_9ENTE|nr:LapA family protein [Enterococcus canis]OJG19346.1 hypothetical protein RU97_GL000917 [Enterococcus canis]